MRTLRNNWKSGVIFVSLFSKILLGSPQDSFAATEMPGEPDFQFALLRYEGGNWNPRPHGLERLAWETKRRTSIHASLEVASPSASNSELFDYPLIVWQGESGFDALPDASVHNLRKHLSMGGTIIVDVSDGQLEGPFHRDIQREFRRLLPGQQWRRVSADHVLYRSFYLIDRHGGRVPTLPHLLGLYVEDRLAVILYLNDLAGALARDEFGEWEYDVGPGGDTAREMTFRLGINFVMYALCLDYKTDRVHLPLILQRRQ